MSDIKHTWVVLGVELGTVSSIIMDDVDKFYVEEFVPSFLFEKAFPLDLEWDWVMYHSNTGDVEFWKQETPEETADYSVNIKEFIRTNMS